MAEYREPNIRARQLGERLLERMAEKGWGVREMSRRLEMSAQWVSAVTRGRARPSPVHLARFLTTLGFRGEEYRALMAMGDEMLKPGLLENPLQLRTLIWHEERATAVSQFHGCSVPGLLQTADYARSLIAEIGKATDPDHIDELVFARMARQVILDKKPAVAFDFYLHEFVLRLPIGRGAPDVMRGQLRQLARLAERSNISIRIIPARCGGHPAMAGHFQLIESADFSPVVYIDSEDSSLFLEEPADLAAYRRVLKGLAQIALDQAESKRFIADLYSTGAQPDVDHLA
ncbi:helix-turn-helix transcriptional regulator [Amycolatopsis mediterranei]|uniref:helix-turn-helix domain-containing protein n=1 Tax=Amycolatopsis mediterranei TaxID=33910 RepID=UPI0034380E8F